MNYTKSLNVSVNELEAARNYAVELTEGYIPSGKSITDLFYSTNLKDIEEGIAKLNKVSEATWLLSAMLIYTLVFDKNLYQQSGKPWSIYVSEARERIGLSQPEISAQMSAARFFIRHHAKLKRVKWKPTGSNRKLARAEYAYEISGDLDATIKHLKKDTFEEFKEWYSSFNVQKALPLPTENIREDISVSRKGVQIDGKELFSVNKDIPEEEQNRFYEIAAKAYTLIKNGYKPLIIDVYDDKEAKSLVRMRDEARKNR